MLTVLLLIALSAFVVAILAAINRAPIWVAVLLLAVAELLRAVPLGR
jgi:hypothetical protein